jgi:hypothetical protein
MSRTLLVIAGVIAFLVGTHAASAFTTQPVNPETMNNRLADPNGLADKMSNGQIRRNHVRATRQSEAPVLCTTVGRQREQPICHEPEYGMGAERPPLTGQLIPCPSNWSAPKCGPRLAVGGGTCRKSAPRRR